MKGAPIPSSLLKKCVLDLLETRKKDPFASWPDEVADLAVPTMEDMDDSRERCTEFIETAIRLSQSALEHLYCCTVILDDYEWTIYQLGHTEQDAVNRLVCASTTTEKLWTKLCDDLHEQTRELYTKALENSTPDRVKLTAIRTKIYQLWELLR